MSTKSLLGSNYSSIIYVWMTKRSCLYLLNEIFFMPISAFICTYCCIFNGQFDFFDKCNWERYFLLCFRCEMKAFFVAVPMFKLL